MNRPKQGRCLLFIHQNFPSPYLNIATHYAADPENLVVAVGDAANLRIRTPVPNVLLMGYDMPHDNHHAPASDYESCVRRGKAVATLLQQMRDKGFVPDLICVNPDWGEGLFLRLVYPEVPILAYAEYYYDLQAPYLGFDPEFPVSQEMRCAVMAGNAAHAITFADADHLQTPTRFQLNTFPPAFRNRSSLLHEGIDTDLAKPDPAANLTLPPTETCFSEQNQPLPEYVPRRNKPLTLTKKNSIVTYISRTLEPFHGWHSFARALPRIQAAHPETHVVIVGRTAGGYGLQLPGDRNWRDIYLDEVRHELDFSRLHFTGNISSDAIISLLQISSVHVYLTYPFTPSRSPLEAMSCGVPLITSDTEPMHEFITQEKNGLLVDFFSAEAIATAVSRVLNDRDLATRLGHAGRQHIISHYDNETICIPRWKQIIEALADGQNPDPLR